ncbi:hypothetical protein [Streptomyces chattanoogensis]|uniref:hypothetical protein n=1 Tax=Streptomyces chattanoogensis TaxID=66876 RepID=UPI0036CC6A32
MGRGITVRRSRKARIIAAGALAAVALTAIPAHAEGYFTSSIGGWVTGRESRHWEDSGKDNADTKVSFSGCSTSNSPGFRYATLQLKEDVSFLPDQVRSSKKNYCSTVNYGVRKGGKWYFNYSSLNGDDAPRTYLNVNRVVVNY